MRINKKPELTPARELLIVEYVEPEQPKKVRYKMLDNINDLNEFLSGLERVTIGGVELDGLTAASGSEREYHLRILYKGSVEERALDV